jgi:hypothetical protein
MVHYFIQPSKHSFAGAQECMLLTTLLGVNKKKYVKRVTPNEKENTISVHKKWSQVV